MYISSKFLWRLGGKLVGWVVERLVGGYVLYGFVYKIQKSMEVFGIDMNLSKSVEVL